MSSNNLAEITANLIEDKIKSEIALALTDIRSDRADAEVSTELPRSYFQYGSAQTYRCPAVFVVPEDIDFDKDAGANYINAVIRLRVAVIVEDKNLRLLSIKSWRYQAALNKILNQQQLVSIDNKVKVTTIIRSARFSPEFTLAQTKGDPQGMFQKEVSLEIDCRHRESL